jgi:hypothetical protein
MTKHYAYLLQGQITNFLIDDISDCNNIGSIEIV